MHVLVTADTLSGIWTYTRELVTGLVSRGIRVTLVSFGEIPLPKQTLWMENLHGLEYRPTAFRLDWMQEADRDFHESRAYLTALVKEIKPDLLHLNQPCYGNLPGSTPRVVVAHGDYISWWNSVHNCMPAESRWLRWYRQTMQQGLAGATLVVSPSLWMLETIRNSYSEPSRSTVIHHGRNPIFFNPYVTKDESVLAVGRFLDASKQLNLLTQQAHTLPVCIVGSDAPVPPQNAVPIRADVKLAIETVSESLKGPQTEAQLRALYSRAAIYAATSRYEPLGMSALAAAFSRCAIVANDIPLFREIWANAALYFRTNDSASLAEVIQRLWNDPELCRTFANRAFQRARDCFTAKRMIDEYLQVYNTLLKEEVLAA
jgi:glycogen(starch) synthase